MAEFMGLLFNTTADACAASFTEWATACGNNPREDAIEYLMEGMDAVLSEMTKDGWQMPEGADDWDIEKGHEAAVQGLRETE